MTHEKANKIFKYVFFSSIIYFILLFAFIIILGRVIEADSIPSFSLSLSLIVAFGLFVSGIVNIIYWIKEKIYKNITYGFGTIFFSLLIFLLAMIISIANAWG
jgi:hypothetical protein